MRRGLSIGLLLVGVPIVVYVAIVALGGDVVDAVLFAALTETLTLLVLAWPTARRRARASAAVETHDVAETLREARVKVREIEAAGARLPTPNGRATVTHICGTARQILDECERDPGDVTTARTFLTYYLDAGVTIVKRYAELSALQLDDPETKKTLTAAESALGAIDQAFDRQLAAVKSDETIDLEAEIKLLEKTVQIENLYAQTGGPT